MVPKIERPEGNSLLAGLPPAQERQLLDRAERLTLGSGTVIAEAEWPVEFVVFPLTAVLSVLSVLSDASAVESAVIGREGMAPLAAFHGVEAVAEQTIAQVPGEVLRISLEHFRSEVDASPELRQALHAFSQALFTFAAQTSACNRKHSVVQRCARWLLVTHDRVPGDEFELTHLFLAHMLGVRRSSVTVAAETLRDAGAIAYSRGRIRIEDREKLFDLACDCYSIIRSTYDRLLDGRVTPSPLGGLVGSKGGVSTLRPAVSDRSSPPEGVAEALDS